MKSHIIHHTSYILLLLFIAATVVSCRPKGILHSRQMRKVLIDLHKTDALLQVNGLSNYNQDEERSLYYAQVLEHHGITQAQFDSSLVWYTAHPALFDKIYPKVLAELKAEEESYIALIPTQKEPTPTPVPVSFTPEQLDSVLWVTTHGLPSSWNPLVHDLEDQLLPQIPILGAGVVDAL